MKRILLVLLMAVGYLSQAQSLDPDDVKARIDSTITNSSTARSISRLDVGGLMSEMVDMTDSMVGAASPDSTLYSTTHASGINFQPLRYKYNVVQEVTGLPTRDGVESFSLGKCIWQIGGWNNSLGDTQTVRHIYAANVWDLGNWDLIDSLDGNPRHTFGLWGRNDTLAVILGDEQISTYGLSDGWHLKVDTNTCEILAQTQIADTIGAGNEILYADVFDGTYGYIIGGQLGAGDSAGSSGNVYRTADLGLTWDTLMTNNAYLKGNISGGADKINGCIYIVSGGEYKDGLSQKTYTRRVLRTCDEFQTLEVIDSLSYQYAPAQYMDVKAYNNKLFAYGGYNDLFGYNSEGVYTGTGRFNDVGDSIQVNLARCLVMDGGTETWYNLPEFPLPHTHATDGVTFTDTFGVKKLAWTRGNGLMGDEVWSITEDGFDYLMNRMDGDVATLKADTFSTPKANINALYVDTVRGTNGVLTALIENSNVTHYKQSVFEDSVSIARGLEVFGGVVISEDTSTQEFYIGEKDGVLVIDGRHKTLQQSRDIYVNSDNGSGRVAINLDATTRTDALEGNITVGAEGGKIMVMNAEGGSQPNNVIKVETNGGDFGIYTYLTNRTTPKAVSGFMTLKDYFGAGLGTNVYSNGAALYTRFTGSTSYIGADYIHAFGVWSKSSATAGTSLYSDANLNFTQFYTGNVRIGGGADDATHTLQINGNVNIATIDDGATTDSIMVRDNGTLKSVLYSIRNTATLDFPSTAANEQSDLTMTVTGAAEGDAVSLSIPDASTTSGTFTAWVSATNTVTVRFHNITGVNDPASGLFKVIVFKY